MGKTILKIVPLLVLGVAIFALGTAQATLIGANAFGAGAVVEGFEGVTPGNGSTTGPLEYHNNFTVGYYGTPYTFASGVTFVAPLITGGSMYNHGDPFINDFRFDTFASNTWGQGWNDVTQSVVPAGTAWMGTFQNNYGDGNRNLEFTFSEAMYKVGAYVTGAPGTSVTMQAYDVNGILIDTQSISTVLVGQWATNFIGIEANGITRVVFSDVDFGIDNLTFEQGLGQAAVPIPPSALLLGSGLLGIVGFAWRRRKES